MSSADVRGRIRTHLGEDFEKTLDTVWRAITDPTEMRNWFFDNIPEFKPVTDFEVEFNVESGDRVFPHQWRVTRVEQKRLIEYKWKYGGYTGDSYVTFELFREEDYTRLRLTHIILEDFQEDIPEFQRESCIAGWKYFINQRLKEYLS